MEDDGIGGSIFYEYMLVTDGAQMRCSYHQFASTAGRWAGPLHRHLRRIRSHPQLRHLATLPQTLPLLR